MLPRVVQNKTSVTSQIACLTEWCVVVWGYPQMAARLLACIVDGKAYTPGSYHGTLTTDHESITIHRLVPGHTWLRARSQRSSMRHARFASQWTETRNKEQRTRTRVTRRMDASHVARYLQRHWKFCYTNRCSRALGLIDLHESAGYGISEACLVTPSISNDARRRDALEKESSTLLDRCLQIASSRIFMRLASVSRNWCGGGLRLQGQPGPNLHELMNRPRTTPPSGARIPSTSCGRHARSWRDRRRCTNLSAAKRSPLAMHRSC
ncbi:hypothetical protein L1887_48456 [Cichorium endivia]|nr:hypothetical protein L1887_48456 [Cichorium endivia]